MVEDCHERLGTSSTARLLQKLRNAETITRWVTATACVNKFSNSKRNQINSYVEIKCQLDATDDFYCRSYCLLNMFRAQLCPSSGAREYYTDGRCLWYLLLWFSSCRYGVELRVVCPVCGLLLENQSTKYDRQQPLT